MLTPEQIAEFRSAGHLTVTDLFGDDAVASAVQDIERWSQEFLATLPDDQRSWYLEKQGQGGSVLRKLDHPVFHRDVFRQLACDPDLVAIVQQLIGEGVCVFFSQIFMKPPEVGGPKPIHQDNYYFGPSDPDATLTVWIALDDATIENGCLYYSDQHTQIYEHTSPKSEPFNLQIPKSISDSLQMSPAPVPRGGVSLHHGNTPHQSSSNRSPRSRRAAAFHYLRNDADLASPALAYDPRFRVQIT